MDLTHQIKENGKMEKKICNDGDSLQTKRHKQDESIENEATQILIKTELA